MTDALRARIWNGASTSELELDATMKLGFTALRTSAVAHFVAGAVSLDEVTGDAAFDEGRC